MVGIHIDIELAHFDYQSILDAIVGSHRNNGAGHQLLGWWRTVQLLDGQARDLIGRAMTISLFRWQRNGYGIAGLLARQSLLQPDDYIAVTVQIKQWLATERFFDPRGVA